MRAPTLLLLAPLALAPLAPAALARPGAAGANALEATATAQQKRHTALEELERWVDEFRRNGPVTDPERVTRLKQLTGDLRMQALSSPRKRRPITLGLLDLAGVRTNEEVRASRKVRGSDGSGPQTQRIRAYGIAELETLLAADTDRELATWIASEVLAQSSQPEERRLAALRLLDQAHLLPTRLALFGCSLDASREVRETAMLALSGWDDEGVHRFMLSQLGRLAEDPEWVAHATIRHHFAEVSLDSASESGESLYGLTRAGMVSADWREAFRALQLIGAVRDDPAVPALIDGLEIWIDRREHGGGSRRIESEIVRELERRSGRRIGHHPRRWRQWWKVSGTQAGDADAQEEKAEDTTWAGFFGLRPVTDRVVFVIDRSRSMREPFGQGDVTRYSEAIDQMVGFLEELGPQTRFRVVVFSTEYDAWKERLQPATKSNLRSAERWLRYRPPNGGTYLEPAVREVLRLDEEGRPDLRRLEADTVIVLCDGETSEGPGWVQALLEGPNEDAALAFHSVQIGGGDDGTLEALARGSGGDFVRVLP